MNRYLISAAFVAIASQAVAHGDLKPAQGGVIAEGKLVAVELVAKPDALSVYLSDHGKPVDAKGASGEVVLLTGAEKATAKLAPATGNELSAKGSYKVGPGTKAIVKVSLPGKGDDQVRLTIK